MSPNALIPSHRKPRRSATSRAVRAGFTGGILTLAVTGTAVPANATGEKPASETQELPTVTAALATSVAKTADTTQQVADQYALQAAQDSVFSKADKAAEKAKDKAVEAKRKAEAEKRAAAARKAKAAEQAQLRASRSDDRPALSVGASVGTGSLSGSTATLVSFLKAQVGKAYVSGATGPSAYDCSGLTQAAFRQIGIDLPRVSQDQSTAGTQVGLDSLQVGDILYWGSAGSAYHVGVYIGDGQFIGAQNSSTGVAQKSLDYDPPSGAVRLV